MGKGTKQVRSSSQRLKRQSRGGEVACTRVRVLYQENVHGISYAEFAEPRLFVFVGPSGCITVGQARCRCSGYHCPLKRSWRGSDHQE